MNLRILVIDDDETDRKIIAKTLQGIDPEFEIRDADSGNTALALLNEFPPDLVFCDVNMPQDNGFDVCQKLKEAIPHLKVIILTGATDSAHYKQTVDSQADRYINKNSIQTTLKITLNRLRPQLIRSTIDSAQSLE